MFELIGKVIVGLAGGLAALSLLQYVYAVFIRRPFAWKGKVRAPFARFRPFLTHFFGFLQHVIVSGGSKGLGKEIALEAARRGANVTILARDPAALQATLTQLRQSSPQSQSFECDVTKKESVRDALGRAAAQLGAPDVVVTSAGTALPGFIAEVGVEVYERQVQLNYLGTVFVMHEAIRQMIAAKKRGKLVVVSSAMAVTTFTGYSPYAPTKAALKSFADSMHNELLPHRISVHHFLPPSMKTEGFENENKIKPAVTRYIEATGDLFEADVCARQLFAGIDRGNHSISVDLGTELLRMNANGTVPRSNTAFEVLLSPIVSVRYVDFLSLFFAHFLVLLLPLQLAAAGFVAFIDYTSRSFKEKKPKAT